jgi:26S proteasome regulatory subunit N3
LRADSPIKKPLLSWLPAAPVVEHPMDVDPTSTTTKATTAEPVPEAEIYFRLLIIHHLNTSPTTYTQAKELSIETIEKMQALNRRSMDPIAAKVWYAVDRTYELNGELADARP